MCGRYVAPGEDDIERAFRLGRRSATPFPPRYNVAPGTAVPAVRRVDAGLELVMLRWGLVPHWWHDVSLPRNTINARMEDAARKPVWRDALRSGRCLLPARGWYEWADEPREDLAGTTTVRQPHYIHPGDGAVVAFAGLMAVWQPPTGGVPLASCAIVTRPAEGPAAALHDRMPAVLAPAVHEAWLDPGLAEPEALLRERARTDFALRRVGLRVGNAMNEGADLIAPL